ncbi:unnamed protein product, partial [Staurois parvus]
PRTLHLLYLVSPSTQNIQYRLSVPDPAFTISGLPQYTQHGNAIILVNTKLSKYIPFLISSYSSLLTSANHWLKLVGGVFSFCS